MRSSLASRSGSLDSFQVLVRLKRHAPGRQYLAEPLGADLDHPGLVVAQICGQLAQAPPREWQPQRLRALRGRGDDEVLVLSGDAAGTATRPPRVQRRHPIVVEPVDHLAHTIPRSRRQPGDHRHRVAARGRQHHRRPPPANHRTLRLAAAPANNPLELTAFLVRQTTNPQWL